MSTYTGNELIAAINDGSILESGVGNHLKIKPCTDQQLTIIIDYLIEHDLASSLTHLDLSNNWLTSLPLSVGSLNNLTVLNLHRNKLTSLPLSFCNLKNLTKLFLSSNQLTSLPLSFGNLYNLTWLNLAANQLRTVPDSFGNLNNLIYLYLDNNPLEPLPIIALSWHNKALSRSETFAELQKKLQLEANQFSDIMAGLVATYLDLANKSEHDNENYCDNFYKIFLADGSANPMASRIMQYVLQGADTANEPCITPDKKGFWSFFVEERDKEFKKLERQENKKEQEAIEPKGLQLATTSSIMKCSFTHNDIATTAFLALLAVVINQLFYNQTTAYHVPENMSEPDGMMYTY